MRILSWVNFYLIIFAICIASLIQLSRIITLWYSSWTQEIFICGHYGASFQDSMNVFIGVIIEIRAFAFESNFWLSSLPLMIIMSSEITLNNMIANYLLVILHMLTKFIWIVSNTDIDIRVVIHVIILTAHFDWFEVLRLRSRSTPPVRILVISIKVLDLLLQCSLAPELEHYGYAYTKEEYSRSTRYNNDSLGWSLCLGRATFRTWSNATIWPCQKCLVVVEAS